MSGNFNPSKKSETEASDKNRWSTQWHCFNDAQRLYGRPFEYDVAAEKATSKCGAARYFGPDHINSTRRDALARGWPDHWWCNPPFDDKLKFIDHALEQRASGHPGMLLLPYEPCAGWWQDRFTFGAIIYEPRGRYNFYEPDGITPKSGVNFPVALVALPTMHIGESLRIPFQKSPAPRQPRKKKVDVNLTTI